MQLSSKIRSSIVATMIGAGIAAFGFSTCDAAMITAYEQHIDEKYVVDTSSIYRPDANHISVLVYYSETNKNISDDKFNYKFRFQNNQWYLLERKDAPDSDTDIKEDETHYWAVVEDKSVAQDVLRVAVAYS
jgi:hypothetical protein